MKNVAIIGSNGMVGSDLVRYLAPNFRISGITRENYETYRGKTFDIIINADGNSRRFWANKHILEDFIASTLSVYKTIFDFQYKLYIYISSSDVYDRHNDKRYTSETNVTNPSRLSPYGLHKYISELVVQNQVKDFLILRSCLILGKNLKKGPIYDMLNNKPLFVTQDSRLQMITTEEIANSLVFLIRKHIVGEIFNMGGTGTVSFRNIHRIVKKPIVFNNNGEKQVYEMNTEKLRKLYKLKTSEQYLRQFLQGRLTF